eukprot:704465-Amorphochlora_amoeboformis.AAC.1
MLKPVDFIPVIFYRLSQHAQNVAPLALVPSNETNHTSKVEHPSQPPILTVLKPAVEITNSNSVSLSPFLAFL